MKLTVYAALNDLHSFPFPYNSAYNIFYILFISYPFSSTLNATLLYTFLNDLVTSYAFTYSTVYRQSVRGFSWIWTANSEQSFTYHQACQA
jgi:hypothetical protein